jgi:hypothetical protein
MGAASAVTNARLLTVDPPQTRYATARDGNQIAYQIAGDGPVDLVYLTGSLSNVDVPWEHRLTGPPGLGHTKVIEFVRCG